MGQNGTIDQDKLKEILGGGWGDLDQDEQKNDKARQEAAQKSFQDAQKFHICFNTPTGKFVLDWLRTRTVELPGFMPDVIPGSLSASEQGFIREGQNSMYREIRRLMKIAEQGPPETINTSRGKNNGEQIKTRRTSD